MAGLWDRWQGPEGTSLETCTVIVTEANDVVRPIHDRMPVIIPADRYDQWLDPGTTDPMKLAPMLQTYVNETLEAYPVAKAVNNAKNEGAELIEPM